LNSNELGLKLRREFRDWDHEPEVENAYGEYGIYQLVGHGKITNDGCGKFVSFRGCDRVDLHNRITVSGENFKGKVYVHKVFCSCDKPSCPICYKKGWAVREAGKIEARLKEASIRFGLVEHIVCSVPSKDYGLSLKGLRRRAVKVLFGCGIVGGVLIFHAFRYDIKRQWYWSPHFHVLGFVLGGYGRCRHCKGGNCYACDGCEGRTYRAYGESGYIIRVLDERITIFGTAWYQLNHASIKKDAKRFHVATWFGACSYRKLKVTVEYKKKVCPICGHDLVWLNYCGLKDFSDCENEFLDDYYDECGRPQWVERVEPNYGSGSYEKF
jgi:hypothetical protein